MKNLKIYVATLAFAIAAFTTSCDKKLDLQPRQQIDAATAIENEQDLQSTLTGAYALIGQGALYGTNFIMLPELQASESYCLWRGTFQGPRQVSTKTMNSQNPEAARTWIAAYRTINVLNIILANLDKAETPATRNRIEGEARLIRAMLYFELVRMYAQPFNSGNPATNLGVPLALTPTTDEAAASLTIPRSTVAQVYTQILADINAAVTLVPVNNTLSGQPRFRRAMANVVKARIHLQRGEFPEARDAANAVIATGSFELQPSVLTAFRNRNSRESIFEIQQNAQNNAGTVNDGLTTFFASLPGIGRSDISVNANFLALYPAGDARRSELFYIGSGARAGANQTGKWVQFDQNIPLARIAEMFLIRAECNFRLGTVVGDTPTNDLNRVRQRANAPLIAVPTLNDILLERRLELAFEGFRIHDIKRLSGATGAIQFNDQRLVFPIPQREIDANSQLVQNPGY